MNCGCGKSNCGCRRGARGPTGATGPVGPIGAAGLGAIIPFASGEPIAVTHVVGGLLDTGAVIGFGSSLAGATVQVGGATIDLSGAVGVAINQSFSAPRDGALRRLQVYFSSLVGLALEGTTIALRSQIYTSPGSNIFTPVAGALVDMAILGNVTVGFTTNQASPLLNVPISLGDRLLLVTRIAAVTPVDLPTGLTGYLSAGLLID